MCKSDLRKYDNIFNPPSHYETGPLMEQTQRLSFNYPLYTDEPAPLNISSRSSNSASSGFDQESLMITKNKQVSASVPPWLKSKWLDLRHIPRSRIILISLIWLTFQVSLFWLSDPSWMIVQPMNVKLDDQATSFSSTVVIINVEIPSWEADADAHRIPPNDPQFRRPLPVRSHLELLKANTAYLEAWVAHGEVLPGLDFGAHDKIDGLWSWLNGSDPRHRAALEFFENDPTESSPFPGADSDSRFRENDELRYSLRSAKAALGGFLRTSHLVSADYWPSGLPDGLSSGNISHHSELWTTAEDDEFGRSDVFHIETGLIRFGQVPQWLDLDHPSVRVGDKARTIDEEEGPTPFLRVHHDWSIYSQLQNIDADLQAVVVASDERGTLAYKLGAVPTFNSGAKEAAMGLNVTDLGETFFYSNDDYYMGRNLTSADFASPLYGPVFLLARNNLIEPDEHQENGLGEYPSYRYTTWLLGERFGRRKRPYIHHVHKTYVRPLVQESQLMFGDELGRTARQRFRGAGQTVNNQLLSYNFVIERHREALLWSYFVARIDKDGDGWYGDDELMEAWSDLGLASNLSFSNATVGVPLPVRDTLLPANVKQTLEESHFPTPRETRYVFSSQDGYALAELNAPRKLDNAWPIYYKETDTDKSNDDDDDSSTDYKEAAVIDLSVCWHKGIGRNALDLFRHMAFEVPNCGDALITLVVGRSGRKGLSAFLPHEGAVFPETSSSPVDNRSETETTPHLPLNDRWQDADFSLVAVARNTGWSGLARRTFAMLLIQRYAYTIGWADVKFEMLTTLESTSGTLERLRNDGGREGHALVGINDDMDGPEVLEAQKLFKGWMEETWPTERFGLPFERS